jgi:hypothetical protein
LLFIITLVDIADDELPAIEAITKDISMLPIYYADSDDTPLREAASQPQMYYEARIAADSWLMNTATLGLTRHATPIFLP